MAPSHEKGRRGTRVGDDEFVLYLMGVPAHCRWQELKDFVRQTAQHIRQAVVYDDPHGYPTGIGQIIVKNEDEAWRTFRKLAATGWDGQVLTVTLAKASAPTKPIAGPKQSPSASLPRFSFGMGNGGSNQSVPSDPVATQSATVGYLPAPPLNYVHAYPASATSWTANPEAHPFSPSSAMFPFNQMEYHYYPTASSMNPPQPQHMYGAATMDPTIFIQAIPYYHQGGVPAGYPDLTTSAAFTLSASSCCSVIVENLHPKMNVHTLKSHFRRSAGAVVEHCEMVNTPHHARDKASNYAVATFASADEAAKVVSLCNGTMLSGNRIMVRLDLDCNRTISGGGGLHVDEDWPSTTPLSASSPFFQPSLSPSAFLGEGWNLFHSTTTTASSDSSSSPSSSSSSTASSASTFVYKNPTTPSSSSSSSSSLSNSTSQRPAKHSSSSSSSSNRPRRDSGKELTSSQTNAKKTTDSRMSSEKQPLVVNGSMSGRAKM